MHLVDEKLNLEIRFPTRAELREVWEVSYRDHLEWMDWNGPYFHDPVFNWVEFQAKCFPWFAKSRVAVIFIDGHVAGEVSWHYEDGELAQWPEFGICIFDSTYWSKGYGSTAAKLWVDYLFASQNFRRLGFTTWSGNQRMMLLGERLGFQKEAQIRQVRFWQGQYYDSVKYGILKKEWQKRP